MVDVQHIQLAFTVREINIFLSFSNIRITIFTQMNLWITRQPLYQSDSRHGVWLVRVRTKVLRDTYMDLALAGMC